MNISSASAASLVKVLTPAADPSTKADPSKPAQDTPSAPSVASGKETSSPGQDVAKKLKDMSKALIALTLIQDPMERAKAAAKLYKDYSQVAKDYADATGGGREAADQANAAQAAGQPTDPQDPQAAQAGPDGTPVPAQAPPPADPQAQDPAAAAQVATPAPTISLAAKPRFVADLYMEEIKTFAGAAKQMYDAAVQEAKFKKLTGKDKKDPGADDIEDGAKVLTEAAKAVEGPDATADVQMPGAGSFVDLSA